MLLPQFKRFKHLCFFRILGESETRRLLESEKSSPFSYVKNYKSSKSYVGEFWNLFFSLCVNLIFAFDFFFFFSVRQHMKTCFVFPPCPGFILSRSKTRLVVIGFQHVGRCLFVSDDVSGNQLLHYFVGTTIDWLNSGIHVSSG